MEPNVISTLQRIYKEIFLKTYDLSRYIFLCGAGSADSVRNALRIELEALKVNVLYPEDLFMDMIAIDKSNDLFSFERLLADESNAICVICESIGSAAELGAFVQNDSLRPKLILCTELKYKKEKNFIISGPFRFHEKNNGQAFYYRKDNLKKLAKDISGALAQIPGIWKRPSIQKEDVSLIGMINYIPIALWFCGTINRRVLFDILREIYKIKKDNLEFQILFNASVNYLIKHRVLEIEYGSKKYDDQMRLSNSGLALVKKKLFMSPNNIEKIKLIDQRRCDMMYLSLYSKQNPLVKT